MRFTLVGLLIMGSLAINSVEAVTGPITTNNGVSACVVDGSCTTGGPYATSETQLSPVTSPASSVHYAAPTNAAESSASISNLAATGAEAAYSSRVANGQGSGNAPDGITSVPLTGVVIAGTTPAGSATSTGTGQKDISFKLASNFQQIWTASVAFVAFVAGALVIL